eukprot:snap_masked-scaffold_1-processed-gene-6.17-mRNA-1 protein AED:1.00 eAED:1.00 QI:0/0/0/0/1/1/2/0/684
MNSVKMNHLSRKGSPVPSGTSEEFSTDEKDVANRSFEEFGEYDSNCSSSCDDQELVEKSSRYFAGTLVPKWIIHMIYNKFGFTPQEKEPETPEGRLKRSVSFSGFPSCLQGNCERKGPDHIFLRQVSYVSDETPEFFENNEENFSSMAEAQFHNRLNNSAPFISRNMSPGISQVGPIKAPVFSNIKHAEKNQLKKCVPLPRFLIPSTCFSTFSIPMQLYPDQFQPYLSYFPQVTTGNDSLRNSSIRTTLSPVLFAFKMKGQIPKFPQLKANIFEFCTDSSGSRFIQQVMNSKNPAEHYIPVELQELAQEIVSYGFCLMKDMFGNYVIQNLLDNASNKIKETIIHLVPSHMEELSIQPHACRVVQKILDLVNGSLRMQLTWELIVPSSLFFAGSVNFFQRLENRLAMLCTHQYGSHVVRKCLEIMQKDVYVGLRNLRRRSMKFEAITGLLKRTTKADEVDYLGYNEASIIHRTGDLLDSIVLVTLIEARVATEVSTYTVNPNACKLVQRVMGDCDGNRNCRILEVVAFVEESIPSLAVDQYGNFVLQHVLDSGQEYQADTIQKYVFNNLFHLSQHKFGSHLGEKSFLTGTEIQRTRLAKKLLKHTNKNSPLELDTFLKLMKDPYANFVLQRALGATPAAVQRKLIKSVLMRTTAVENFAYGRHVVAYTEKLNLNLQAKKRLQEIV